MSGISYEKDADGIVTLTMDLDAKVNSMSAEYRAEMKAAVAKLQAEEGLTGVVIASAKKTFFAGADLNEILAVEKDDIQQFFDMIEGMKADFRALEKLPVPVVAAINGAALGGGFEVCLACNYRIAVDDEKVVLGLPEVGLGLLPGAGGVVRTVNMLGLEKALPFLLEGTRFTPAQALELGLIDETVDSLDALLPRAKAWILENRDNAAAATKPWDIKGFSVPGGNARHPAVAQLIMMAPPMLYKKTQGKWPAPEKILDCAVTAVRLDFDTALLVETRGLCTLVVTPEAKQLVGAFFNK